MNIGFIVCICCCLLFLIFALIFTILKDKAAILISGFNSISKDQREMYDQKKMSKDQRNAFLIWGLIFAVGAILANFISQFFAIIAFIVWLIIFFKDVHLDEPTQGKMIMLETSDTILVLSKTLLDASNKETSEYAMERKATYVYRKINGKWLCAIDNSYGTSLLDM